MAIMPPTYRPGHGLASVRRLVTPVREGGPPRREDRRGSAASRGYDSRWQRMRPAWLARHPLCCCCLANGITSAAVVIDHVVPHRGDKTLFWDRENWQGLCWQCHRTIKSALEQLYDMGKVKSADLRLDRAMPEHFYQGG